MTAFDRGYRTGEALEQPERLATWPTVRREVQSALARHGLGGWAVLPNDGDVLVRPDAYRVGSGVTWSVRRDTLAGLLEDAEALALSAVQALAAPRPCPCCAIFPLLCEYHGAANVAALVTPVVNEAPAPPRPARNLSEEALDLGILVEPDGYTFDIDSDGDVLVRDLMFYDWYYADGDPLNTDPDLWSGHEHARQWAAHLGPYSEDLRSELLHEIPVLGRRWDPAIRAWRTLLDRRAGGQ